MGITSFLRKTKEVNKVLLLPLAQIRRNPNQPRCVFDEDSLQELADSISANGLLQPISVRETEDGYELVAGERRTLAYRRLGEQYIPSIIVDYSDRESAVFALLENLQRKDLSYLEEAYGIARLMEENSLTQSEAARHLGKAQSTVANKLRLLKFPISIQRRLLDTGLTERHARALLPIGDEKVLDTAISHIHKNGLTVQQTEEYIAKLLQPKKARHTKLVIVKDVRIFQNTINKAVDLMNRAGLDIFSEQQVTDRYIEYIIKIPREQAYRRKL
ncbi:MAG: ParB/RepB/Spo0J family partition protein [Oscillospiraceae bacterium]|nr:ParB/RepB/Spo0J family partition protein [Oscillospiraceae bacterium]